jgi:opacity protein-like surface antigen
VKPKLIKINNWLNNGHWAMKKNNKYNGKRIIQVSLQSSMGLLLSGLACVSSANGFNNPFDAENRPPQFYGGASIGYSKHEDTCDQAFFNSNNCDDSNGTWKVYGGARVNPMMGIEGGYRSLGETSLDGISTGGDSVALSKELSGYDVSAVGFLPVSPVLESFAKAGIFHWEQDQVETTNGQSKVQNRSGNSLLVGAGAQFSLQQNMKLRAEWEHIFNAGDETASSTDVDMYSVGVSFSSF